MKIVQISDLHINEETNIEGAKNIIDTLFRRIYLDLNPKDNIVCKLFQYRNDNYTPINLSKREYHIY